MSIYPNWYELLSDFKLIETHAEWHKLSEVVREAPESEYSVFRHGFTFTVIRPPADQGTLPGLTFWDNRTMFFADLELFEPIVQMEDAFGVPAIGDKHPFLHHPKRADLLRLHFKPGIVGYSIGLEVNDDWWKHLRESKELGDLADIKGESDYRFGTTRLTIATLPYSEFGFYYQDVDYGRLKEAQQAIDSQLKINGWDPRVERDSEIRDPWRRVEHKYFSISHRSV